MRCFIRPFLLALTLVLAACATSQAGTNPPSETPQTGPQPAPISTSSGPSSGNDAKAAPDLTRLDQQGAVTVEVTPLNLGNPSDKLEFDIALNTHSVNLSMDLAALATLTTDTGLTVQATLWDATPGGHHVSGRLVFPAMNDGKSILEGASKLTLTIINLDAPARVFEWQLP
jgi:hypothetical protein